MIKMRMGDKPGWNYNIIRVGRLFFKYVIDKDELSKRKIEFEMSKVEENINTKSYDYSSGGKSIWKNKEL